MNLVYLLAANLHLRLSVFFDSPSSPTYEQDLMHLWTATRRFLEEAFGLKTDSGNHIIKYSTNYILQMVIACGFTLLKLLNSFFAGMIDLDQGKKLFTRTIQTIRQISVVHNDLPSRLAEVLAQLWRAGGNGSPPSPSWDGSMDDTLQLKVRCRMSMSLVFDSVWRWREDFQSKGRDNLESRPAPSRLYHFPRQRLTQDRSRSEEPYEPRLKHCFHCRYHCHFCRRLPGSRNCAY